MKYTCVFPGIALFLLLFIHTNHAQEYIFNSQLEEFKQAMNNQLLAQNENDILPLKRLDTVRLGSLILGTNNYSVLQSAIDRYTSCTHFNTADSEFEGVNSLIIYVGNDIDDINWFRLTPLINSFNVICILRNLDVYDLFPDIIKAKAIIHSFQDSNLEMDIAIQQIFGGLEIAASKFFDQDGNVISSQLRALPGSERLAYVPASYVNAHKELLNDSIEAIVLEALNAKAFPGCQVLAIKDKKVFFHKTWGYHTYKRKKPQSKNDLYDLASVTKVSSALPALMKLNGDGKFQLEKTIGDYFPKFKRSNKGDLMWREVLAHHARLKAWIPYWRSTIKKNGKYKSKTLAMQRRKNYDIRLTNRLYLHNNYKEKKIYKAIRKSSLNRDKEYLYSGLSFYIQPDIVSNLTGVDFETYIKETFYKKLGAHTITYNPMRFFTRDQIIPTENDTFFRMTLLHGVVHDEGAAMMNGVSSNAGLFATANDLAKLFQMYLDLGTYGGERYLQSDVVSEFIRCQYCQEGNRRGLGFDKPLIEYDPEKSHVAQSVGQNSFGHSGYTGTFVWADPDHDIIYIFFSNRVHPTRLNRKIYEMGIRPRIQQVIYDSLEF